MFGHLVSGDASSKIRPDLVSLYDGPRLELDDRVHYFTVLIIRYAEYRAIGDTWHLKQLAFNLRGIDISPSGNDHVLGPIAEIQKTISIQETDVPRYKKSRFLGPTTLG